jgi:hypothetical protein
MQAPRSHRVSPSIEASQRAWIPSPPAKPLVLVLWLNQVTQRFCGEAPQTQCADSGREPLPCLAPVHDFVLLFLPPCRPHLIPFGHKVHRAEPACLSTPRSPRKAKIFRARSSPAPTQINRRPAPVILDQVSPHHVNHSSHQGATIHWSSDPLLLNCFEWRLGPRVGRSIVTTMTLASSRGNPWL